MQKLSAKSFLFGEKVDLCRIVLYTICIVTAHLIRALIIVNVHTVKNTLDTYFFIFLQISPIKINLFSQYYIVLYLNPFLSDFLYVAVHLFNEGQE